MAKAEHRPNPDPHWVKETLVEDYLDVARKRGVDASSADAERVALGDLANHEAVTREQHKGVPRKKRERVGGIAPAARALADQSGVEVFKKPLDGPRARRPFNGFLNQKPTNPKQAAAIMRLGQILSPRSAFRPSKEFDYQTPWLAQRFVETMSQLDRRAGEFEGKSEADCARIVWRRIEDICDHSTGVLGPWWVK